MGKHRHEYAHTHAHTHTSDSGSNSTQCSLHPESQHTLGLSRPPGRPPQGPHLHIHTARALKTHPKASCRHWLSEPTIVATHHGLPHGHPLPQPHTRWCACTHTLQSHTHKLSHMRLLRTVMFSHMDTITPSEQSIFHIDTIAPPEPLSDP